MLISDHYREQNKKLHETNSAYGTSGHRWARIVSDVAKDIRCHTILDYGCGKQTLKEAVPHLEVIGYDPSLPGLDSVPEPQLLVVCTDVLEHIEPELIDDVLDDLKRVVQGIGIFVIYLDPSKKFLPDGRNAHLIQKPLEWWIEKLAKRFFIEFLKNYGKGFLVIVKKEKDHH